MRHQAQGRAPKKSEEAKKPGWCTRPVDGSPAGRCACNLLEEEVAAVTVCWSATLQVDHRVKRWSTRLDHGRVLHPSFSKDAALWSRCSRRCIVCILGYPSYPSYPCSLFFLLFVFLSSLCCYSLLVFLVLCFFLPLFFFFVAMAVPYTPPP